MSVAGAKITIFMPAYNAAGLIEETVKRIPESVWSSLESLWIINDGSTDATQSVVNRLAAGNNKIKMYHRPINRGYGEAVKKGLLLCRGDRCDFAICLHADGQYPPEEIPVFIDAMIRDKIDLMQGSRIASGTAISGGMPQYKYIANRILTFFENIVFNLRMSDYHSGYLFYGKRALETVLFYRLSSSFDFDLEVIASARARGLSIGELPIPTRYAGEVSHLNPVTYGLRVLWVMAKYLLRKY